MDQRYDVAIIGGGPAGLTAAIYASRANLKAAVIEASAPGGKLMKTWQIENYPGFEKINGADLGLQMYAQAAGCGAQLVYGQVEKIQPADQGYSLQLADGSIISAAAVIVAAGTKERTLDLPQADQFTGHGISYCAVCDGAFYRNQSVAVIGGGNSALEEALYLASLVKEVFIVVRRTALRADPVVSQQIEKTANVKVIGGYLPDSLLITDNKISGLRIRNTADATTMDLAVAGIFPYIGADPATDFLQGMGVTDEKGYIIVNEQMETVRPGLYAAGDVTVKNLRQVVTAVNDGAIAADSAARRLRGLKK